MKKNSCCVLPYGNNLLIKYLLMTKLSIAMIFVFSLQSFAHSFGQDTLSLKLEKVSLKKVFKAIEEQSDYRFVYKDEILPRGEEISIAVKNAMLSEVMKKVLKNTLLSYRIMGDKLIVITTEVQNIATQLSSFIKITGKVVNDTGDPLIGVSVLEKGTSTGTSTDAQGNFSLDVTSAGAVLVFSNVSFETQEVPASGRTELNVTMVSAASSLNDVVVIGYQTVRRRDLTGAIAVVNAGQANRNTSSTVGESLQGLAAGVIIRNTGEPGAGAKIDIRGSGTLGANNPLYVIDGMLSDATPDFNPNDIESIQILKDASAAAIYGSRAANGVIIITTKKGKAGPTQFGGNVKYSTQQFHKKWDLLNASDYASLNKTAYANSGFTPPTSSGTDFNPAINTDWQDLMMRTGNTQDYNLGLSGGSNTSTYYISGDYFKNKGAIIDNSFERAGVRINTTAQRGIFKFGENIYLSSVHQDPLEGNVFLDMLSMLPTMPVMGSRYVNAVENPQGWSYGDPLYANTFGTNTYAQQQLLQRDYNYYKIRGNAYVELKLLPSLTYRYNVGLEASFDFFKGTLLPGIVRQGTPYYKPTLNENRSRFTSILHENTLNFDKQFGKHQINAVAGISYQNFKIDPLNTQKVGIPSYSGQYYFVPDQSGTPSVSGAIQKWSYVGYLSRLNYSYDDRYLVSVTYRRDGSSLFGPSYRWGDFPSVSAAWRVSKEAFFKSTLVNDLKVRGSYGQLGNSEILTPWEYYGTISALPRYVFGTNETINYGATNIQLANSDLRWETKKATNIGIDAGFLDSRLTLTADYFIIKTSDVLTTSVNVPLTTGNAGGNPPVNAASLKNTGFEITAGYHESKRLLKWNLSVNVTSVKNKVLGLGKDLGTKNFFQSGDTRTETGHPIGEWYVLKTDGIFQSQEEINNYKNKNGGLLQGNAKPGDIKYVDVDGDGNLDLSDKDRTWAGSPWPKLQAGLVWDGSYKHITFAMQWYGVFGNKLYNRPLYNLDKFGPSDDQAYRAGVEPWTANNHSTTTPRIGHSTSAQTDQGLVNNALPQSDRWLESGSYVRLRNIEIGYTIPDNYLKLIGFKSARVFINGQNLITITKYKGLDPDIVGPNIFERGLDNGQYPALRMYAAGINFGF